MFQVRDFNQKLSGRNLCSVFSLPSASRLFWSIYVAYTCSDNLQPLFPISDRGLFWCL